MHNFSVYVPPELNEHDRFNILRNVFWAIDSEIRVAKGLNAFMIAGDFNKGGMRDFDAWANARGIFKIEANTRGSAELDAVYCSNNIKIINQIVGRVKEMSDHCWIQTKVRFQT